MFQQKSKKRVLFKRTLTTLMLGLFTVAAILYGGFVISKSEKAYAATNNTVNFQARLQSINGNIVPDGYYNIQFKLYNVTSSGTALWTETYYDSNGATAGNDNRVQVRNGYVSVSLGSQNVFPAINWDQNLYLTMNIGGLVQTATPTWDGEMDPRLKLTGVPYAFKAGQLAQFNETTGYTSTLSLLQPTGGNQNFQVADQGAAGTYTLLTQNTANTNFIQNQSASAQSTSAYWISGTGRADTSLLTPALDTAAAGTLAIGNANATTINIGSTDVARTINVGTATGSVQTINIGSQYSTSATTISGGSGGITLQNGFGSALSLAGSSGSQVATIGTIASSGSVTAGSLRLGDGTTDNFGATLNTSTLTANRTISLPDAAGTLALTSNTANFIRNQTTQQTANMNIVSNAAGSTAALVQGAASGTVPVAIIKGGATPGSNADLLSLQDSTGTPVAKFTNNGSFTIFNGASSVFTVDQSGQKIGFGVASPSAKVDITTSGLVAAKINQTGSSDQLQLQTYSVTTTKFDSNGSLTSYGTNTNLLGLTTPAFTTSANGTSYYYVITATNTAGETIASASIGRTTNTSALAWTQVNGAIGYKIYRNTSNSFSSGNLLATTITSGTTVSYTDGGAATTTGLPPTAPTGTKLVVQGWAGQGGSAFVIQDGSANVNAAFSGGGNQLTLGRIAASGTTAAGSLLLGDGTTSNFGATLNTTTLTANRTISLPNESGTVCLQSSANCGFAVGSAASYIQNQNAGAQTTSNFWLSGTGRADTSLLTPIVDTAATGGLNIGTTTATTITIGRTGQTLNTNSSNVNVQSGSLSVNGTSTVANYKLQLLGTNNSSSTSSIYGFQNDVNYNPAGASLSNVYAFTNTATISGSSLDITNFIGIGTSVGTSSGYTGTVGMARGLSIGGPTIGGSQLFTDYRGINIGGNTANGGNTTGTITNTQLNISGTTTAASTGGTINNYGINLTQPAGSGTGTTNNYGLYIQGAGAGSTNWSIYNSSSAANYFSGNVLLGTTSNAGGYKLHVSGGINATSGFNYNGTAGATTTCTGGNVLQNAVVQGGIVTGGSCVANGGGVAPTIQDTYDNSSSPATILLANSKNFVINAADTATDPSILFNLQCVTSCSTNGRFAVQNAGNDYLTVNPNGTLVIGSSSNNITFSSNGSYVFNGTSRRSKTINLNAEYMGAVLDAGSGSNNSGTMTSGIDLTNRMNYYKWTTTQGTNQSYDIDVLVPVPADFDSWASNPLAITGYTTNTTNGTITLETRDTGGTVICNFVAVTPGSTSTWAANNTGCTLSTGTYTPGSNMVLRVRLQAGTSGDTRVGNIILSYNSKY